MKLHMHAQSLENQGMGEGGPPEFPVRTGWDRRAVGHRTAACQGTPMVRHRPWMGSRDQVFARFVVSEIGVFLRTKFNSFFNKYEREFNSVCTDSICLFSP